MDDRFTDAERQLLVLLVTKAMVAIDRIDLPDAYDELLGILRKLEGVDTVVYSRREGEGEEWLGVGARSLRALLSTGTLPEATHDLLAMGICPDCTMPGLRPGPTGGMCRNEACPSCGAEFNVARFNGEVVLAHRNSTKGSPDVARLRAVFGIELRS